MRALLSRLAEIVMRRSREDRLASEVEHHLDQLTEELEAGGMSRAEARLAARRQFGNVDRVRMLHRDQRGLPIVDALAQDVRFAARVLRRDWGFTLTAALVLGAGIGVNNMFFTLVYAHKFRGLPIERPERVLFVSTLDDRTADRPVSLQEFEQLRLGQRALDSLAAYVPAVVTVGDEGRAPDRFDAAYLSSTALATIGVKPSMGRGPEPAEDRPGAPPVVVLGADAWRVRYGGDPAILGKSVLINGSPAAVVGVLAERSGFPSTASVWLPLGQLPGLSRQAGTTRNLRVFGRLRDGATESDARAEVAAIFARLEGASPQTNRNVRARVVTINEWLLGNLDGWMPFITAAVIVVLVACANVANLMIARALHRRPEIAIRTTLGASRVRLVRQLIVEGIALALLGAAVGLVLSVAGVSLFRAAIPVNLLPYWFDYSMDPSIFASLIAIALASVFVFGFFPAVQASRADVNQTLKDGSRLAPRSRATRLWTAGFLVAEIALAMVLLLQVALGNVTTRRRAETDAALRTTAVVAATLTLPVDRYATPAERADFFRRLGEKLEGHPRVEAMALASHVPVAGASPRRLDIEGAAARGAGTAPPVGVIDIGPGYFETLGFGVTRGRAFADGDGIAAQPVAIVNERFVELHLPGSDPLGRRIAVTPATAPADAPPQWLSIVGVAPSIRYQPGLQAGPVVYVPILSTPPVTVTLLARTALDPSAATALLREETRALDAGVPLYRMQTLQAAVHEAEWNTRVSNYLALTVCLLSLLLASVGLYAVTAQGVTLRTREIGIRMALGARTVQVAALIVRGVRVPLLLGLLLGALGALAWDRAFSSGLVGEYAANPAALIAISGILTFVVGAACLVPLRRAVTVNPVRALRHD